MADLHRAMRTNTFTSLCPCKSAILEARSGLGIALLVLAFASGAGSLRAETTNALTLNDCLRESLSANHALLARSAESDAATARARGSSAARLPRLFLQGSAQHTSDPYRLQPATENNQPGIFTRNTWQAAAGVTLPLYAGGRLAAEQDAARLLAEAASGDFAFARQALAVRGGGALRGRARFARGHPFPRSIPRHAHRASRAH